MKKLTTLIAFGIVPLMAANAYAAGFPERPLRVIVANVPGSGVEAGFGVRRTTLAWSPRRPSAPSCRC